MLSPFGFADVREAHRRLKLMAEGTDRVRFSLHVRRAFFGLAPALLRFVGESPDPDMALRYIEDFVSKVGARILYYTMFHENPLIIVLLAKLCGTSRFLAELLIAPPESFDVLTVSVVINNPKTLSEKQTETLQLIADVTADWVFRVLWQYKNGEVLRIWMRNILGQADLWTTIAELSGLAETTLQTTCAHICKKFQTEHGVPLDKNGTEVTFAVISMGEFGGRELNFSSNLDLMYVYSAEGETTRGMSNADYFSKLGLELVNRLRENTGDSTTYELDLRLRPFGKGGAIVLSLVAYQNYL